jgi:predicted DNA-binding transcriptional regulator YafY
MSTPASPERMRMRSTLATAVKIARDAGLSKGEVYEDLAALASLYAPGADGGGAWQTHPEFTRVLARGSDGPQ